MAACLADDPGLLLRPAWQGDWLAVARGFNVAIKIAGAEEASGHAWHDRTVGALPGYTVHVRR